MHAEKIYIIVFILDELNLDVKTIINNHNNDTYEKKRLSLPSAISLSCVNKSFSFSYTQTKRRTSRFVIQHATDTIEVFLSDQFDCACDLEALLKVIVLKLAKLYLIPFAEDVLAHYGFSSYTSLRVRNAKSRWASCSSKGVIMLSTSLLFVDAKLVTSVILHEACHLKHMNHGKAFYAMLGSYDAEYKEHKNQLRAAQARLPWFYQ